MMRLIMAGAILASATAATAETLRCEITSPTQDPADTWADHFVLNDLGHIVKVITVGDSTSTTEHCETRSARHCTIGDQTYILQELQFSDPHSRQFELDALHAAGHKPTHMVDWFTVSEDFPGVFSDFVTCTQTNKG